MRSSPFVRLDGLIAPAPSHRRVAFLYEQPFAHRGLHGGSIVENSRAAFAAAVAVGHGIECDVRQSRDGEAIVFHDESLDRLTGEIGPVSMRSANALAAVAMRGCDEFLPRLEEVLSLVAGRVPLLIELKAPAGNVAPLCLAVRRALEGYRGAAAIMAFDPRVGRWFATHAPRIARGLVMSGQNARGLRQGLRRRLATWQARPDFIACDVRDLPSRFATTFRSRGVPILAWTVRDAAAERVALAHADQIIYEGAA